MKTPDELFVYNCWYNAGWASEIEDGKPLARTFLEKPIVMYRGESGDYFAMDNRCCHRAAPLSLGRIEGDCIRCMYHGMKYDSQGKCIEIPGQDLIGDNFVVPSYPLVEKSGMLWIWMGDSELANPDDIHDYGPLSDPGYVGLEQQIHYDANWMMIIDNLADFSHLAFVHPNTLGGSEEYAYQSTHQDIEKYDNGFQWTRWHKNSAPPPYHSAVSPEGEAMVDRRNVVTIYTPGVFFMETTFAPVGWDPDSGDTEKVREYRNCQFMTPETRRTTHFWWNYMRNYDLDNDAITHSLRDSLLAGFMEDKVLIEEQQILLENSEPFQPRMLTADRPFTHFRKVWDRMIKEEREKYPRKEIKIRNAII